MNHLIEQRQDLWLCKTFKFCIILHITVIGTVVRTVVNNAREIKNIVLGGILLRMKMNLFTFIYKTRRKLN